MGSVAQIEQAIAKLSAGEFVELEQWFDAERNRKWDRQIEADSASGALDFLLNESMKILPREERARRMNSSTTPKFRQMFAALPVEVQAGTQSLSALEGEPAPSFASFQKSRQSLECPGG